MSTSRLVPNYVTDPPWMVGAEEGDRLAAITVRIRPGTDPDTISVEGNSDLYNGVIWSAVDNIGKGETVDGISLASNGRDITIAPSKLGFDVAGALTGQVTFNEGSATDLAAIIGVAVDSLRFTFRSSEDLSDYDLTAVISGTERIDARAVFIRRG